MQFFTITLLCLLWYFKSTSLPKLINVNQNKFCRHQDTGEEVIVHTNTIEGSWKHAKQHFRVSIILLVTICFIECTITTLIILKY